MPIQNLKNLLDRGALVKNETDPNDNTADRVGSLFVDLIMSLVSPYDLNASYPVGSWVVLGGALFRSIQTTVAGESPDTAPAKWEAGFVTDSASVSPDGPNRPVSAKAVGQAIADAIGDGGPDVPVATTEVAGKSRRSTVDEAVNGEVTDAHVTPEGLAAALSYILRPILVDPQPGHVLILQPDGSGGFIVSNGKLPFADLDTVLTGGKVTKQGFQSGGFTVWGENNALIRFTDYNGVPQMSIGFLDKLGNIRVAKNERTGNGIALLQTGHTLIEGPPRYRDMEKATNPAFVKVLDAVGGTKDGKYMTVADFAALIKPFITGTGNTPPYANSDVPLPALSGSVGTAITPYTVPFNAMLDAQGGGLAYRFRWLPLGLSFNGTTRELTGTPQEPFTGQLELIATDTGTPPLEGSRFIEATITGTSTNDLEIREIREVNEPDVPFSMKRVRINIYSAAQALNPFTVRAFDGATMTNVLGGQTFQGGTDPLGWLKIDVANGATSRTIEVQSEPKPTYKASRLVTFSGSGGTQGIGSVNVDLLFSRNTGYMDYDIVTRWKLYAPGMPLHDQDVLVGATTDRFVGGTGVTDAEIVAAPGPSTGQGDIIFKRTGLSIAKLKAQGYGTVGLELIINRKAGTQSGPGFYLTVNKFTGGDLVSTALNNGVDFSHSGTAGTPVDYTDTPGFWFVAFEETPFTAGWLIVNCQTGEVSYDEGAENPLLTQSGYTTEQVVAQGTATYP